jgi:hypothetical protein
LISVANNCVPSMACPMSQQQRQRKRSHALAITPPAPLTKNCGAVIAIGFPCSSDAEQQGFG